ncbi:MAG: MurR/RpiR family transcriptional regulator [Oscillospiraceae bacterium]|nr:MurR/RpiR family transcriptional regulator [Oscillospiraceae bacterium]
MKNVLLLLRENQETMSNAEVAVAKYICANPEECAHMTIRELAERTFSSPSSVVRMCRSIGFVGYREFRQELLLDVHNLGDTGSHEETELDGTATVTQILDSITQRNIQCLQDTRYLLDEKEVETCVGLLQKARTVLLFGIGASLCVARDAYLKFLRVDKPCVLNDDWHSQLLQARNATKEDVAIIFSYSGQTREMVECMEALGENGCPRIAVTRSVPSPVTKLADHCLYTATNEFTFRIGALSSRMAQLNVVDILYAAYVNAEYDHCMKRFVRTHIFKDEKGK